LSSGAKEKMMTMMTQRHLKSAAHILTFLAFVIAVILTLLADCRKESGEEPEAISLLGKPLYRTPAGGEALSKLEASLREAAAKLEASPDDPENIILYGRTLSALWRFHDAIDVYTRGIAIQPDHALLYRHRGHRYISVREFDKAVVDLTRAAELKSDEFDIWYHLGLAHFLRGEFEKAQEAYQRCREVAQDDASIIAVSNWLYLTLMRQDKIEEAASVLEGIREDMEPGENIAYFNLLLFDKGLKTQSELEAAAAASNLDMATIGYGLACRLLVRGEKEKAFDMFRRIADLPYWPAFGVIAAEAELSRAQGSGRK
jgi:tetratricopeptide (TPR) repeat protein